MTVDQLKATRDAVPFRPFIIHLTDGRAYRIPHRDYLSISPTGRTVLVYGPEEAYSILDVMLVTELYVEPPPPQPATSPGA